jgi:hypothetical protein
MRTQALPTSGNAGSMIHMAFGMRQTGGSYLEGVAVVWMSPSNLSRHINAHNSHTYARGAQYLCGF